MAMIMNPEQAQEDFLTFFEDLYMEFSKFGKLDALHVCDNLGDHMIGTYLCVYIPNKRQQMHLEGFETYVSSFSSLHPLDLHRYL